MNLFNTACPRNCYSTCSFQVRVEEGKIVRIDPQPLNRATPEGICLKGLAYLERNRTEERILHPLRRTTRGFEPISWDQALTEICDKLRFFRAEPGPQSILFYAASGTSGLLNRVSGSFWKQFGGATTVYGNLCWPAGLEATRMTLGDIKHNVAWDLENARLILLWGKNPAETNIQQMIPIEKAQARGATLVVIDPRRTPSSERADLLIQPIPGTDGLLALAVAKLLMEEERIDRDFIDRHVLGFEAFQQSLENLDLEKAGRECGVPLERIRKLADLLGSLQPMTLAAGYGMQRFSNGGQTTRCLLALSVLTGNIGKPGACWHYADLQSDCFSDLKEPLSYYPTEPPDKIFRRSIATARLGEEMLRQNSPPLKMAWVERGNPLAQNPDSNRVRQAFRALEYRVVVDQFLTDTAREADLVLPAKSMFEQSDIITSYWNPYVQLKQKVLEPAGEVKPETEIYRLLGQKLGFPKEVLARDFPGPGDQEIDAWLTKQLAPFPELSLEKLKAGPLLAPGLQEIAFADLRFATPSGKIELLSEAGARRWGVPALPTYEKPVEGRETGPGPYPFQLLSPNNKNRIHSQFGNLELIRGLESEPTVHLNLGDALAKGIEAGERIRVFNDRGSLILKAQPDAGLRPGCVVIMNGYWHQEGACANTLSAGRETDMGHGTAFHDNRVDFARENR